MNWTLNIWSSGTNSLSSIRGCVTVGSPASFAGELSHAQQSQSLFESIGGPVAAILPREGIYTREEITL